MATGSGSRLLLRTTMTLRSAERPLWRLALLCLLLIGLLLPIVADGPTPLAAAAATATPSTVPGASGAEAASGVEAAGAARRHFPSPVDTALLTWFRDGGGFVSPSIVYSLVEGGNGVEDGGEGEEQGSADSGERRALYAKQDIEVGGGVGGAFFKGPCFFLGGGEGAGRAR